MSTKLTYIGETLPLNKHSEIDNKTTIKQLHSKNFPFSINPRFLYIKQLGRGGSGLIFQAFDKVLQRHVALKFLLNPNTNNRIKLVAEARAQANVEHVYICPIYEVVESEEGIYLVMQLVDGETLQEIAPSLSIEQLLVLNRKVAEGLQAAHDQGLIHRDFKPANVVVSMASDLLEPLIVDFGLAQQNEPSEEMFKQNTNIVGTKGFIAPEILSEPNQKLHQRMDVFSFGANLLYCFTREIIKTNNDDTLHKYLATTKLPKDIQIIVSKCMAFKPFDRYQSAEEVSQEITRYLNGDPIKARAGKGYWLRKKLKKHRWLTVTISIAVFVIFGMYTNQLYQAHLQSIREHALLDFNSQLKEIEYQAQLTYMSPRHNIETNVQQWRSNAEKLENELLSISPNLFAATHYALGRIYHVLREHKLAVKHLQVALSLEENHEGAFYLAISFGALYNNELETLRYLTDQKLRESRLADITSRFKAPAIKLLGEHISSAPHKAYAKALLAYYQQDWEKAIKLLNGNTDLPNWYYQDDILRGDILLAKARKIHESGKGNYLINSLLEQSLEYYEIAANIAPSDPYVASKSLHVKASYLRFLNQAGNTAPEGFMDEISISERNLQQIDSSFSNINQLIGQITHLYGLNSQYNNGTPEHWFSVAETKLLQAKKLNGFNNNLWIVLGQHYSDVAKFKMESNLNPVASLENAINALTNISVDHRDYYYFNELGTLNRYLALQARKENKISETYFQFAINNYLKANNHSPHKVGSLINAASTLRKKSERKTSDIRKKELFIAKKWLEEVIKSESDHFVANYYLSLIFVDLVELNLYREIREKNYFDSAVRQILKTKSVNSTHPYVLDLELKLKQFELEHLFSQKKQWIAEFKGLVVARAKLMENFSNNNIVTHNYIGMLAGITGYRIQLGLPAENYITELQKSIQTYPNIENAEAYQALSELFVHWNKSELKQLNLIDKYNLRDKQSSAHKWALYMVLIASSTDKSQLDEGIDLLTKDRGMLPFYREMVLEWANERASMFVQKNLY